jgi:undecaprenyl-diphosphatase
VLEMGTKYAVARPRPPHFLVTNTLFPPTHGFPSCHALAAAALYGLLLVLLRRRVRGREWQMGVTGGMLLLIFLIGLSRLYLNAHWLSDMVGGYALGGAYCALATAVYGWIARRAEAPTESKALAS